MPDSATTSLTDERRMATSSRLTAASRRLTAERGLSGFTVEELCAEVGVSRRTFFNYFRTKEDAVVGEDETEHVERLTADFSNRGPRGWAAVVDDLLELAVEHARSAGFGIDEHADLVAAIEREPRLAARFMQVGRDRELELIALAATRELTSVDDPHARAAIEVVSSVLRTAGARVLDPGSTVDFESAIHDALAAMRAVLSPVTLERDPR